MMLQTFLLAICFTLASNIHALPSHDKAPAIRRSIERLLTYTQIGITSNRNSAADYDADMKNAKAAGIDAFALNIGVDPYTDRQLQLAYESAANNDMKVFISFDFNWWHIGQANEVGQKIAQYAKLPAQLKVDDKVFVSSFAGDGLDVAAMRSAAGVPLFFAPNFHPEQGTDMTPVDGLLNWMAWPNNGNNKAPTPGHNISVQAGDDAYVKALGGKPYVAPASPWFSTHFGPEVSYSKNWIFPSDLLWYNRWNEILKLGPRFVEIVTWNDYGESHYIGRLDSPHTDDGASKWVNDMPHEGWLEISKPFIAAYKAAASSPNDFIKEDSLIYWYRPAPRGVNCDSTDTCMVPANNGSGNYFIGRPDGWQDMEDAVFVVSLLKSAATVEVTSGNNSRKFDAPAGAAAFQVPMGVGSQQFGVIRDGQTILSGTSPKDIIDGCVCGLYNFNAFVGTLPPGAPDNLQAAGLAAFAQGLHVSTCQATPSLTAVLTSTSSRTTATTTTAQSTSVTTTPRSSTPTSTPTSTESAHTTTTTTPVSSCPGSQPTTTMSSPTTTDVCVGGTGPGNYVGLCNFCCHYGYCPPGPCTCTQSGAPVPTPPTTGQKGVPLDSEDDSYLGLCSFACNHGYCPPTACKSG
ncbi:glycosyl hydrolase family 71-domain-containing protein [Aspergillus ambiguus]|uniref:glycoside hydrolase family 71 protein n=1 Tax=Aspergillus ambiguus TaxID=176160 RepID=UPI003CCDFA0D